MKREPFFAADFPNDNPLTWSWDETPKNWIIYGSIVIEDRPMVTMMYRPGPDYSTWIMVEGEE